MTPASCGLPRAFLLAALLAAASIPGLAQHNSGYRPFGGTHLAPAPDQPATRPAEPARPPVSSRLVPDVPHGRRLAAEEQRIIEIINLRRAERELPELKSDPYLMLAARGYADFIALHDAFGHAADERGPSARATAAGYDACVLLENIALRDLRFLAERDLAHAFVNAWIDSPAHRRNLFDPRVFDIGVGVARSESGRYFSVQLLGRPQTAAARFDLVNETGTLLEYTFVGDRNVLEPGATVTHWTCEEPDLQLHFVPGSTVETAAGPRTVGEDGALYHPRAGERFVVRLSGARCYRVAARPLGAAHACGRPSASASCR